MMLWEFMGFPCRSTGKQSACSAGDPGSINGWGRSPGGGLGYPFHYSSASLVAQMVKNPPEKKRKRILLQCKRRGFNPWMGKIPWRRA